MAFSQTYQRRRWMLNDKLIEIHLPMVNRGNSEKIRARDFRESYHPMNSSNALHQTREPVSAMSRVPCSQSSWRSSWFFVSRENKCSMHLWNSWFRNTREKSESSIAEFEPKTFRLVLHHMHAGLKESRVISNKFHLTMPPVLSEGRLGLASTDQYFLSGLCLKTTTT